MRVRQKVWKRKRSQTSWKGRRELFSSLSAKFFKITLSTNATLESWNEKLIYIFHYFFYYWWSTFSTIFTSIFSSDNLSWMSNADLSWMIIFLCVKIVLCDRKYINFHIDMRGKYIHMFIWNLRKGTSFWFGIAFSCKTESYRRSFLEY